MSIVVGLPASAPGRRTRARRLVDQLHIVLERQIDEGRIKPGERLATERELAIQFSTSRNIVRAALAELHKAGKITRRVGRGTIVVAPAVAERSAQALSLLDASPAELMEFRLALEPGLAEAITLRAGESDLRAIKLCVDHGDAAESVEAWEHWDRLFHQLLVAATHNRVAASVYDAVTALRHQMPWIRLDRDSTDQETWRKYQIEHRRIAEALLARDAPAAADAIRAHLLKVRAKMLGY
jgi:DNA-binding FadR family transcriptional regulator